MIKVPLTQKILNIKGRPIINEVVNPETQKPEKKEATIRDYLLTILSTKFVLQDKKEAFWTTALGIQFSDEKTKEVEISDDKAKFLKRIIENNKVKIMKATPMGQAETEVELFFPYELGQLLVIFETGEDKKE